MNKFKIYSTVFFVSLFVTLGVSLGTWFFDNNIYNKLDKEIVITHLKEIKKLEVLEAEIFAHDTFEEDSYIPFNKSAFAIMLTAKAIYGIDLSNNIDIEIIDKKIILNLPNIKLLHLNINPNDIKIIFAKKGILLNQNEFEELKQKHISNLYSNIRKNANKENYIKQAQKSSETFIKSVLLGLGFKEVEIYFKENK